MHRRETHHDTAVRDEAPKRALRPGHDVRGRRHGCGRNLRTVMTTTGKQDDATGARWLLDEPPAGVFSPERLSDEHRLMAQTTDEFVDSEVLPNLDRLERKDWTLARHLIARCGELGLLGVDAPEAYGGLDLDKTSSMVVAEHISRAASFAVTFGGQTNLCILPIALFGTDDQKRKY